MVVASVLGSKHEYQLLPGSKKNKKLYQYQLQDHKRSSCWAKYLWFGKWSRLFQKNQLNQCRDNAQLETSIHPPIKVDWTSKSETIQTLNINTAQYLWSTYHSWKHTQETKVYNPVNDPIFNSYKHWKGPCAHCNFGPSLALEKSPSRSPGSVLQENIQPTWFLFSLCLWILVRIHLCNKNWYSWEIWCLQLSWIVFVCFQHWRSSPFYTEDSGVSQQQIQTYSLDTVFQLKDQGSNPPTPNPTSTIFPPFQSVMPVTKSYCSGGYISTGVTAKVHALGYAKVQWYQGPWLIFAESWTPADPGNLPSQLWKKRGGYRGGKCFTKKCVFFCCLILCIMQKM